MDEKRHIGLIGGGPAALFMFKRIVASGRSDLHISIFEKQGTLGVGLPYGALGANPEHITNVSANEIPDLRDSVTDWIHACPKAMIRAYGTDPDTITDYKVLPRLLFGRYLSQQFSILLEEAKHLGISTELHLDTAVQDIRKKEDGRMTIISGKGNVTVDDVVVCTGHTWPSGTQRPLHYFDSPYPPSALQIRTHEPVAIKGASLTAIDAIRTLARQNGTFREKDGHLSYATDPESRGFKMVMHSRSGFLPAVRFHLEDPHLFRSPVVGDAELMAHRESNNGFVSLDFIFERNYKDLFRDAEPEFYAEIRDLSLEEFVEKMLGLREHLDPFTLLKAEYAEAEKSIRRHRSIRWKENLAVLSYTLNPPAKYFSAEDMIRLKTTLMPLISIVIAFIPQSSCRELLALHDAGVLELVAVGEESEFTPHPRQGVVIAYPDGAGGRTEQHFKTFVDCTGQAHLPFEAFPFEGLRESKSVYPATLRFASEDAADAWSADHPEQVLRFDGKAYMRVPGIAINDHFGAVDAYGASVPGLYIMAVPFIGGYNPDYSGLDFCDAASAKIAEVLLD